MSCAIGYTAESTAGGIGKAIQVSVRATLPTQAEIDAMVRRALERAGRTGQRII